MSAIDLGKASLPPHVEEICLRLKKADALPLIVGGWVRDRLMGLCPDETRDIDIEVFRLPFEQLQHLFQNDAPLVYPKFGVLRLPHIDLSLPRLEHCIGKKYNDFCVQLDPHLSFKLAGMRRDFTVNAIGWDLFSLKILDPWGGVKDIKNKLIKPISTAFVEDGYRILRAAQLIARFDFVPDPQLLALGMHMSYKSLSQKHIQYTQSILKSAPYKEKAFRFLQAIQWSEIAEIMVR